MKLHFDWDTRSCRIRKQAIVVVMRGRKNRILYNSGIYYFYYQESVEMFINTVKSSPDTEYHNISILQAYPPEGIGKGYWCPYCRNWEYWMKDSGGYRRCPICGISDNEYFVKNYNHLWKRKMKSKKDLIEEDKVRSGRKRIKGKKVVKK